MENNNSNHQNQTKSAIIQEILGWGQRNVGNRITQDLLEALLFKVDSVFSQLHTENGDKKDKKNA